MLKSMSRAASSEPNVARLGMPIDQKVTAGSILVLADPRFNNRRLGKSREAARDVLPDLVHFLRRHNPRLRVRINARAVLVERDFQPAALQVWHSVTLVVFDQPGGQCWRRKSVVSGRNAKIKDALPGRENFIAQSLRKKLRKPRSARKYKVFGGEFLAFRADNIFQCSVSVRFRNRC